MIELLGILAGCLTTLCWVPQLVRTWRRGTADDISGTYLFTLGSGVAGWVVTERALPLTFSVTEFGCVMPQLSLPM